MRTIGLIGGMSWVSSADYYRLLNEKINEKLGGENYARCVMYSFNFADIIEMNRKQDWDSTLKTVTDVCMKLEHAGAEGIMLCANTMHLIADKLSKNINIPIIHIAEATANEIAKKNLKKAGLLGTKFTMEMDFFKDKSAAKNIETVIPTDEERDFIHQTIFGELGKGVFKKETKKRYLEIINSLSSKGAEGIILGCTEIPLLIKQDDISLPIFDTLKIHVDAGVEFAVS